MSLSRRHFLASSAAGTAVFGLGLSPAFAGTPSMPDWHLGYTSAPAGGFDPEPMRLVFGKAPNGLEGSLYRNGPAQFLYGKDDYARHWFDGDGMVQRIAIADGKAVGLTVECRQSNIEGELVTWIQQALGKFDALVLNPGAYSHTSIAIHDAIRAVGLPVIEVHLSNIHAREAFRHHSYVSPVALGVICGLGASGYKLALHALAEKL